MDGTKMEINKIGYRWVRYTEQGPEVFLHVVYYYTDGTVAFMSNEPTRLAAEEESLIPQIMEKIQDASNSPVIDRKTQDTVNDED